MIISSQVFPLGSMNVKITGSENSLIVDTSIVISEAEVVKYFKPMKQELTDCLNIIHGKTGAKIIKNLMIIPGIEEVSISSKNLNIKKSPIFDWQDLIPRILYILEKINIDTDYVNLPSQSEVFLMKSKYTAEYAERKYKF
jgi:hypothetical protein